ncbi:calcium homeostasis modulator protein 6 [Xyrichtys novacula]|uniref:Calcium homeostasis modulator protein 6 n=1 Tax=Xyrichtys novacula TaxID=13765 RepID=A0AAV1EK50_XYRNO|nr:calcium homeostasis modulator protein 6 [Xyrichtys novacula]
MESRQQWLTRLKNELSNSPLVSNVAFGFILMGLEKLVELEFECPCNPTWNGVFSSAFFIIPAVMAFTLMLIIQGCRCDAWCSKTVSLSSFVPAIVWLILLFLDGQYFACAMTDWEGRFVIVDKAAPQKWCEPVSEGDALQELMLRSQQLFVFSQVIGIILLIFICMGLVVYVIRESCRQELEMEDSDVAELTVVRMSSLRNRTS